MLHKLALATKVYSEEELLEKLAIISREDHLRGMREMEQKALELAKLRGAKIPTKMVEEFDPAAGGTKKVRTPAVEEMRTSPRGGGKTVETEVLKGGEKTKVKHRIPEPSPRPADLKSQISERAVREEFGDVSKSKVKQLRHRILGPLSRFWSGQNVLGSKWGNRLALLGALGASGLGVKAYLDANKTPEDLATGMPANPEYLDPYMLEAWKGAGYVEDIASTPRPVAQPKITPPTTKPPSALASSVRKPGAGGIPTPGAEGISGGGPSSSGGGEGGKVASSFQRAVEKRAVDDALFPLVAAGTGGVGSYLAAEHFLQPYLQRKRDEILAEIAKKQQSVKNLEKIHRYAPLGAAAAGAILLAALAAYKAKSKQRERGYSVTQNPIRAYDPSGAGYMPEGQIPFGSPEGFY